MLHIHTTPCLGSPFSFPKPQLCTVHLITALITHTLWVPTPLPCGCVAGGHLLTNEKHKLCGTLLTRAKAQHSPPWFGLVPLPFTGLPLDASQGAGAPVAPSPQASTATVGPGGSATRRRRARGEAGKAGTGRSPEATGTWQERLWAGQAASAEPGGKADNAGAD